MCKLYNLFDLIGNCNLVSWITISGNSLGQAANMHMPLSPSSIIWYRPMNGDAV